MLASSRTLLCPLLSSFLYPYSSPSMLASVHLPQMSISKQVSHVLHFEFWFQSLYPRAVKQFLLRRLSMDSLSNESGQTLRENY